MQYLRHGLGHGLLLWSMIVARQPLGQESGGAEDFADLAHRVGT
jgi:hypothetical protein